MILVFLLISFICVVLATSIVITTHFRNSYKFFSVFSIFLVVYSGWFYAQSVTGCAYNHHLPHKFQLIWGQQLKENTIELWVNAAQGDSFSQNSRLYTVPWSQSLSDKLNEAKKSLIKGIPVVMGDNGNTKNKGNNGGLLGILRDSSSFVIPDRGGGENLNILANRDQLPQK